MGGKCKCKYANACTSANVGHPPCLYGYKGVISVNWIELLSIGATRIYNEHGAAKINFQHSMNELRVK